jgi:hypothetical protein
MKYLGNFLLLLVVSCSIPEGLMNNKELKSLNYHEIRIGDSNKNSN